MLVAAAVPLAGLLALLGFVVVGRNGGGAIQPWDDAVGRWFLHTRNGLVGVSKIIAFMGDAPILGVVALVCSLVLLAVGLRVQALIPLVAYLGGEFFVYLSRTYIHRPRPSTAGFPAPGSIPGIHEMSASFPSGHATAGSAVLFSLAALAAITWRAWWPWIVGALLVMLVSGSRLVLGVHWFSDVLIGTLVGASWGVIVAFVLIGPALGRGRREPPQSAPPQGPESDLRQQYHLNRSEEPQSHYCRFA